MIYGANVPSKAVEDQGVFEVLKCTGGMEQKARVTGNIFDETVERNHNGINCGQCASRGKTVETQQKQKHHCSPTLILITAHQSFGVLEESTLERVSTDNFRQLFVIAQPCWGYF
jgi:hypothetical protein